MPKGYWIAHVEVDDPAPYPLYVEGAKAAFERHGARFLARGGAHTEIEGPMGRSRHVVIEFPSYQAAVDCWNSPEYQAARAHRLPVSTATIVLVEGLGD
ncbi:DUF1330 domain-containing protein [Paralimibaculum aggregatum]|uniref:DUF1330 domain-containing protein n=1 Tax=Paralimibaculum aggregatum TaxID=3036245 RepID=A0ABQ6LHX5_9RHOB|nr:DUF1330 domain-containing protein [Limibaculum sp. NKW23]GMG82891.1 DUF1330 domain-containing protein [Limibaculum sp. NKW23]